MTTFRSSLSVLAILVVAVLSGACKKPPETQEAMTEAELVAPEDLSKATHLTDKQRLAISMRRGTGGPPECSGEELRASPDPDLTFAKCFYYERKDYHIRAYRDRYAATSSARLQSCFDHTWVGQNDAKPPTELDYTLAIKQICAMDFPDMDKVKQLRKARTR